MSMAREAGGLLTSVKDFYLWLEALFNSPTSSSKHLIKPILLRQMMTPSLISRKNPYGWDGYGYGLIINDNGNVIEHTGEVYGFETCFKRLMKEQINIILFSNIFECPVGDYADYIQSILTTTEHGEFGAKRLRQRFNTTSKTKKRFKNKFLR
ncbi:unnamed protein product [Didymodactylos carnosus]|uniref:Beta-lactamase-related domain-containing protein n=1 Tax=Didymodactylos carnosus TaxID=1234261 RepID=A0A815VF10_9BILA|nr:unnamed protein product [Didymodactylos carnosus]CAF1529603.1 unnamed protein product [Didymodactylos carnosus]CAF4202781.1 unnamed protein product [Didymodactylos carnosus]CAF4388808.1 unnamed protein product [Didymodactylos carnosus]